MVNVIVKDKKGEDIKMQRGKGLGKMEAEIKRQPQAKNAKDCQPPETGRETQNKFSFRASRGKQLYQHLDFKILAPRTQNTFLLF